MQVYTPFILPLPDSVEKLSLSDLSPNVINSSPDKLTSLSLENCDLSIIPFFPASLTELKLTNCTDAINSAELSDLKQLHIRGGEGLLISEYCKNLESLIIYDSLPEVISKSDLTTTGNIVFPENVSTLSLCSIIILCENLLGLLNFITKVCNENNIHHYSNTLFI